jgi:hypothetical protein
VAPVPGIDTIANAPLNSQGLLVKTIVDFIAVTIRAPEHSENRVPGRIDPPELRQLGSK